MKIFVVIKQVPDTETQLKIEGSKINESGIKWIVSPFDEHALEESLVLKGKTGGEITAVTLGPERANEALRTALALGVDRAILIKDDSYNVLDSAWTARVLAAYLKKEGAEIILTGNIAIDSQSSMVPAMIAEELGCAAINNVIEVNVENNKLTCRREIEGGVATMESGSPVVISATKNLNNPRYPSLKGIMTAKKKSIESISVEELGVSTDNRIEVVGFEPPPARPAGRIIEGSSPAEKAKELARLLKEEVKVI